MNAFQLRKRLIPTIFYIVGFALLTGMAHTSESAQNNREQTRLQWCSAMIDANQITDSVVAACYHKDGSRK